MGYDEFGNSNGLDYYAGYGFDAITGWDSLTGAAIPQYAGAIPQYAGAAAGMSPPLHPSHPAHPANGAYRAGVAAAQQGGGQAPPTIAYGQSLGIESQRPSKPRLYPLGFSSGGTIAASASAQVTSRPQILFRPQRLVVPSSVAANFNITDIRVGKNSQLVQATALPASIFQETAVGIMMTLDTAQVGSDVTLSVANTDGAAAHAFAATMFGASIDN